METQTLEKPTFDTQDEFNRKPIAENIIRLLTSPIDLSPMVIDGGWGTGKTKFCQKLIQFMQEQHPDYRPVYIDAFRSDHSGEPLLALFAKIIKACTPEDTSEQPSEQRKDLTKEIAKAAGFVMKTVAKAAVGHVLKQNTDDLVEEFQQIMNGNQDADSLAETVTDAAATIVSYTIDATVEALLKEQIEAEKNLETLRACLKRLATAKPIILFIDELDRCRPDYAVDMLEVIKHVFDVENVKVVLVTNTKQLRAAINHRYGAEVDAHKYLDKFLKYSFALPDKVVARFEDERTFVSIRYCQELIELNGELSLLIKNNPIMDFLGEIIQRNNLSLRETETLVRYLEIFNSLAQGLGKDFVIEYKLLIITAIFIFCFYPKLAEDINRNRTHAEDFAQLFNIQSLPDFNDEQRTYISEDTDILAITLIKYSCITDPRFNFRGSDIAEYWNKKMNSKFLMNSNLGYLQGLPLKFMPQKLFSILKNTFQVLSLEQTPQ
ncbi:KAP family P-loop NTPase fold protein [Neisseria sicca]|uniref:KAP family P-loop NTPase fold protein n=1 Tax=Neisseria sicca TaxID=490 RepID=UPI003C771F4D